MPSSKEPAAATEFASLPRYYLWLLNVPQCCVYSRDVMLIYHLRCTHEENYHSLKKSFETKLPSKWSES